MGAVCCCLHMDDVEEHGNLGTSIFRYCICLQCLTQPFIHVYTGLFPHRGEVYPAPSSVQGTSPLATASLVSDNSTCDTYRSPPRPLPFDDPRCSRLQCDALLSRRDKSSSHFNEEFEPLRSSINDNDAESVSKTDKWNGSKHGGFKFSCSESSLKHPSTEVASGVIYFFSCSEDEDVCPTCLEDFGYIIDDKLDNLKGLYIENCVFRCSLDNVKRFYIKNCVSACSLFSICHAGYGYKYTSENPRITMRCSHHFHLSCIYEWMERSEACPVCGKVMVFSETK